MQTCEDLLVEWGETFWVGLSRAANGGEVVVPAGTGTWGTIRNDDVAVVSVSPAEAEGTEGQADPLAFTVGLTVGGQPAQLSEDITVDYKTRRLRHRTGDRSGPARRGLRGEAWGRRPVGVVASRDARLHRRLARHAAQSPRTSSRWNCWPTTSPRAKRPSSSTSTTSWTRSAPRCSRTGTPFPAPTTHSPVGTIEDDAPAGAVGWRLHGAEGTDQSFAVTLADARSGETVTVDYAIAGAGVDPATDPAAGETLHDYTAATGSLERQADLPRRRRPAPRRQPPAQRGREPAAGLRAINENPQTLRLVLSDPHMAVLADRDPGTVGVQAYGEGTIVDDPPPVLSVGDFTGPEGSTQSFSISLSGARAGETVTVDYGIAGAGARPATAPLRARRFTTTPWGRTRNRFRTRAC